MREIKFRGKVFNVWVYGHYLPWHSVKDENGKDVYAQIFVDDGRHSKQNIVGAHTIGQYTGLTDKNGKEIYEGDIVCSRFPEECEHAGKICSIGDIQFRDGMFGIEWTQWKNDTFWGIRRLDEDFNKEIEVIGNIYDNPELLKGDKE